MIAASELEIRVVDSPQSTSVVIAGNFDVAAAPRVREVFQRLTIHHRLVVDLAGVTFIDSVGVGVLAGAAKQCQDAGVQFVLAYVPDATYRVLEMTGLTQACDAVPLNGPTG